MEEYNLKTKVVGVDISNELTTYAIVDVRGNILAEDSFSTMDYPDVNNFVTALSEKVVMLVEGNGGYETIRSIGVSAPSASSVSYGPGCRSLQRCAYLSLGRVHLRQCARYDELHHSQSWCWFRQLFLH